MKKTSIMGTALLGIMLLAVQLSAEGIAELKSKNDKVSYGIGVSVARNLKMQGIDVDLNVLIKGLMDSYPTEKLLVSEEELQKTLNAYQEELRQTQAAARKVIAEKNKKDGEAFLSENKTKEGVITLQSGLQYRVLENGKGKIPAENDTVTCNYRGYLINGDEFDNSKRTGHPVELKVDQVIRGWSEALKRMPTGSKWQLFIPPELAYGERGAGYQIGPNTTLLFDVELVAIK